MVSTDSRYTGGTGACSLILTLLLLTSCGDTGCRIEETRTRVTRNGETYWERCWKETCPGVTTQTLRCSRE